MPADQPSPGFRSRDIPLTVTGEARADKDALLLRMRAYERLKVRRVSQNTAPDHIDILLIPGPARKLGRHEVGEVLARVGHELIVVDVVVPLLVVVQERALRAAEDDAPVAFAGSDSPLTRDHVVDVARAVSEAVRVLERTRDAGEGVRRSRRDGRGGAADGDDLLLEVWQDGPSVGVGRCDDESGGDLASGRVDLPSGRARLLQPQRRRVRLQVETVSLDTDSDHWCQREPLDQDSEVGSTHAL